MTRLVEIRGYRLRPGTWPAFVRLFAEGALPLLERAEVDVVAFGRSPDSADAAFLIRSFADLSDREQTEAAFYDSAAWRAGPREPILACIETYTDTLLTLDTALVDGLRRVGVERA
jgi:hypothetical protein